MKPDPIEEAVREALPCIHGTKYDCSKAYRPYPCSRCVIRPAIVALVREQRRKVAEQKNAAYAERNRLVALLSALYPASLERHPDSDTEWEDDWRWIVFIDLPPGQVSWHIHDSELPHFDHLLRSQGREWDGHSNEVKWSRVSNAIRARYLSGEGGKDV